VRNTFFLSDNIIYIYVYMQYNIYMYHVSLNMFGVHLIVLFMGNVLDITNTVCVYIYNTYRLRYDR
jgi:hypothetical protein